jgi:hypothetical protein
MLTEIHPKLPMRDKPATKKFYEKLGFQNSGGDYDGYLMIKKDHIQIHFFEFKELNPLENYGQVYIRVSEIEKLYQFMLDNKITMPQLGRLETKPWGQKEFSIIDPDHNLLTFGQEV